MSERYDIRIDRPADEVWAVVSNSTRLPEWFPTAESCVVEGSIRTVTVTGGWEVVEEIVTNDPELRRFQYSVIAGGPPRDYHLATIDVLEDGAASRVIYSVESKPASASPQPSRMPLALEGLKRLLES